MSYLSRAQSFVERGEIMRAFYQLVNGLQRNPNDKHALDLLVDLYIREFQSPGVERDLLLVLEIVPQGVDIYEMIYASLEKSGDDRRLKSLIQTRERENLLPLSSSPSQEYDLNAPVEATTLRFSHQEAPQRQAKLNPPPPETTHARQEVSSVRSTQHPAALRIETVDTHLPFDLSPNPRTLATQKIDLAVHSRATHILTPNEAESVPPTESKHAPKNNVPAKTHAENAKEFAEENATTGVFSSIDLYLDEEHKELRHELAQRSKKRLLWVGLGVLLLILLLVFAAPNHQRASSADAETDTPQEGSDATEAVPQIDEPLPADATD